MLIVSVVIGTARVSFESAVEVTPLGICLLTALAALIMLLAWIVVEYGASALNAWTMRWNSMRKMMMTPCRRRSMNACYCLRRVAYRTGLVKPTVIEVPESPVPTRSRTPRTARRSGGRRIPTHRKVAVMWCNPSTKNHCAFMALLVAAGRRPTIARVRWLRRETSRLIMQDFAQNKTRAGFNVREVMKNACMGPHAYTSCMARNMWASPYDAVVAANILDLKVCIAYEKSITYSEGAHVVNATLRLANRHWTLRKRSKSSRSPLCKDVIPRGGMRNASKSRSRSPRTLSPTLPFWPAPLESSRLPPSPLPDDEENGDPTPPSDGRVTPGRFPASPDSRVTLVRIPLTPTSPPLAQHEYI